MIIKVFDGYKSKYTGSEVDTAIDLAQHAISLDGNNVFTGSNEFQGIINLGSLATVDTVDPTDNSEKVANTAFVKAQGYISGVTSEMISTALGYTPYDGTTNPEGFITGIGANLFKLAGSVILYGVVSVYVFGLIRILLGGI